MIHLYSIRGKGVWIIFRRRKLISPLAPLWIQTLLGVLNIHKTDKESNCIKMSLITLTTRSEGCQGLGCKPMLRVTIITLQYFLYFLMQRNTDFWNAKIILTCQCFLLLFLFKILLLYHFSKNWANYQCLCHCFSCWRRRSSHTNSYKYLCVLFCTSFLSFGELT